MYGYEVGIPLSIKDLLTTYSQEDIFKIVFKEYPDLDILYLSPFREDNHPNCFFDWYKGKLYFKDFADKPRDCFQAVKDFYNLETFPDLIKFVVKYFDNNPIPCDERPKKVFEREIRDCSITFRVKSYELQDDLYWKQYFITEDQLTEDHVSVIYWYRFYSEKAKKWVVLRPFDICYAISGFDTRCKIYRPQNHNKKSKWLTNCTPNDVGNLNNIDQTGDLLIITKSYKDARVIRNQGYRNVIWFQSEMMTPCIEILSDLISRFERIIIFYDNDDAGILGASNLQLKFYTLGKEVKTITSPCSYMKDPAEMVSIKQTEQVLKDFLWNNCQV
jgi:hypothetical protein